MSVQAIASARTLPKLEMLFEYSAGACIGHSLLVVFIAGNVKDCLTSFHKLPQVMLTEVQRHL